MNGDTYDTYSMGTFIDVPGKFSLKRPRRAFRCKDPASSFHGGLSLVNDIPDKDPLERPNGQGFYICKDPGSHGHH